MRRIIGIGETVLDIIFRNNQPTAATPGGSTFNAMISLGRTLGRASHESAGRPSAEVLMVTETGDDQIGDITMSFMESNGVSTSALTRNQGTQSHVTLAFLNERNDAQYLFYKDHASASLQAEKVANVTFAPGDIVLFGSFFAINPKIRNYTRGLLTAARQAGAVIYYDINFRRNHIKDLPDTFANIEENCRLSDFVRGSAEDFGYLFGTSDPQEVYDRHISKLCRNFICTCGPDPVHVFCGDMHLVIPAPKVETVSTIGAGDNFNAGFIYGLVASGLDRGSVLSEPQWRRLVNTAGQFSSNVVRSIYNYVDEDFMPV